MVMAHLGIDSKKWDCFQNKSGFSKTFIENAIQHHSIELIQAANKHSSSILESMA